MGTRTGDMDPSVMDYLCNCTGKSADEMYDIFNKKSGFLGVSGVSNDTRDVEKAAEEGNKRAQLAISLFGRTVANYLGAYFVRLKGKVDLIVFSAGVGENAPVFRKAVLDDVKDALGIVVDEKANEMVRGKQGVISAPESKIKVVVIPTDEEVMIARDCYARIVHGHC